MRPLVSFSRSIVGSGRLLARTLPLALAALAALAPTSLLAQLNLLLKQPSAQWLALMEEALPTGALATALTILFLPALYAAWFRVHPANEPRAPDADPWPGDELEVAG